MAPRPKSKTTAATTSPVDTKNLKHKRRFCRYEGCQRIVKSQGLCQRHGAKPRKCKVDGCEKQAQGNFDRMCKSHFKAMKRVTTPLPSVPDDQAVPPPPEGVSVYDSILPSSISYIPTQGTCMPLIAHLKAGFDALKPPAWHRNEERRARGLFPISNPATQLEGWERELVWMEILLLTGAPNASFRHLARAWGRDKGFHMVLAQFICERHGDVRRKKRQGEEQRAKQRKKRKLAWKPRRGRTGPGVISADIWDDSCYGDADYNEALAADIFNFSAQEFNSVSRKWKEAYEESSAPSSPTHSVASAAAVTAILADGHQGPSELQVPELQSHSTQQIPVHSLHYSQQQQSHQVSVHFPLHSNPNEQHDVEKLHDTVSEHQRHLSHENQQHLSHEHQQHLGYLHQQRLGNENQQHVSNLYQQVGNESHQNVSNEYQQVGNERQQNVGNAYQQVGLGIQQVSHEHQQNISNEHQTHHFPNDEPATHLRHPDHEIC